MFQDLFAGQILVMHAISRMQRANNGRMDSRKGRVDMWFIVTQFLVVYEFRCAVISSFISVCSVLNCDDAQHFKFSFQTITKSEVAQFACVRETTHTKAAICAVQGSV